MIRPTHLTSLLLALILCTFACGDKEESPATRPDAEFRKYIAGFTSGVIFKDSEINIVLQEPSPKFTVAGDELDRSILDITPSLEGELIWKNDKTIRFIPSEKMKSGTRYEFVFHVAEVLDVEHHLTEFPFSIYTKEQGMKVEVINLKPYEDTQLQWNQLKGWVVAADYMDPQLVEDFIEVELDGKDYAISWTHESDGRAHRFYVDSVERKLEALTLSVSWDTEQGDFESSGSVDFEIPSINNFSYRNAEVARDPEQHIRIEFTDPVDATQSLKGLVRLKDYDDFRFEFESNVLKAYPSERVVGPQVLQISKDVQNSLGYALQEAIEVEIDFTELKPLIRSAFNGTILPSTNGKVFPFEAVNLRAVDVDIKRIYENNIPQFLQVNELATSYQLSRVGKTVLKKKIDLSSQRALDYGQWNVFTLDLDELIRQEPGAIYQVNLSFRPSYSIYPCDYPVEEDGFEDMNSYGEEDYYDWEYYDSYYYYVPGYDWEERENPCHISYYVNRRITHNILATDIGLIAKRGKDGMTYVAVNDIKTAQPIKGVDIQLYDGQNQVIARGNTKGDGTIMIESKDDPVLLVASRGEEKAYLKMGDGASLS
ncbi:MAG: hypothetical protein HKO93_00615, partial [Flavobacteriales bacterium]|nr:hypothetical protein [Flavobacteriales bacterium]